MIEKANESKDSGIIDVEAIIAEIRRKNNCSEPKEEAGESGSNLNDDLVYVSRNFSGGHWPSGGIIALLRKFIFRLLGLKEFNKRVVSILVKDTAMINGTDIPESSEILANQRRTINMLIQLSKRLDKYDQENIEKRISVLENQVQQLSASEKR